MTGPRGPRTPDAPSARSSVVWIDSRVAVIARWIDGAAVVRRIESDVPGHHRSAGHVRHNPAIRHGGGGASPAHAEAHRDEHLARFLRGIERLLPREDDLVIEGPGTVHEQLAKIVREHEDGQTAGRAITVRASGPMTARQIAEQVRLASGEPRRRRTYGAHRWSPDSRARQDRDGTWPSTLTEKRRPRSRQDVVED